MPAIRPNRNWEKLRRTVCAAWLAGFLLAGWGCGTMKSQMATEQLLLSDAVDKSISSIDFRVLRGKTVYLDTTYVKPIKGNAFVNADYIISSLRQQLFAAGCLLQENQNDAEYVVEARVGALGADGHDVTYGIPASNLLNSAANLLPNAPPVPAIPEVALAKRSDNSAAAKVGVFAYHRESRRPVWQSGVAIARSRAKDFWVLGAGPFQRGSIYDGTQFAGQELVVPLLPNREELTLGPPKVDYFQKNTFDGAPEPPELETPPVTQAGFENESPDALPDASESDANGGPAPAQQPTAQQPAAQQPAAEKPPGDGPPAGSASAEMPPSG